MNGERPDPVWCECRTGPFLLGVVCLSGLCRGAGGPAGRASQESNRGTGWNAAIKGPPTGVYKQSVGVVSPPGFCRPCSAKAMGPLRVRLLMGRHGSLLMCGFFLLAGLAGCVQPGEEGDDVVDRVFDPEWAKRALVHGEGHNHEERLDHIGMTTPNFEVVGWDPMISGFHGTTPGGYACGDVEDTQDGRRLAVAEARTEVGFAIADVTDPLDPVWLGELVMPTTRVYDLAVVPDGKHVVLVMSNMYTPTLPALVSQGGFVGDSMPLGVDDQGRQVLEGSQWRHRCNDGPVPLVWGVESNEDPIPRPFSILLVDIQDPSTPTIVDQKPLVGFGHSVDATRIDGTYWVTASNVGNPNQMTWQFYNVVELPTGNHVLDQVSMYVSPLEPDRFDSNPLGGHTDGWLKVHPVTGDMMAFLVGGAYFIILDMSQPMLPEEVSIWTDRDGRDPPTGNIHSAYVMPELMNGRHYTVIGPEFGGKTDSWVQPSGTIWVIDTTDPADPVEVAAWTLPYDVEWTGQYLYSPHYLTVLNQTVFVSMYHGGIWALDLSGLSPDPSNFTLLDSIGVFMPVNESPEPPEQMFRWTPNLQEAYSFADSLHPDLPVGILVTFDSNSGVYVVTFDASDPAPPPEPWPIEPVTPR